MKKLTALPIFHVAIVVLGFQGVAFVPPWVLRAKRLPQLPGPEVSKKLMRATLNASNKPRGSERVDARYVRSLERWKACLRWCRALGAAFRYLHGQTRQVATVSAAGGVCPGASQR